ncbi:hypothetical protein [Microvirga sp. CF3016]|uniref:hypothetical protein n=1 Tax=Microvirga sp. CF3016 TaxID=3110181 RepID=UPI002E76AE19|nr:hypothetical protein [Microvirga sp. CF3016]MEE1609703.1 hypothetical protein [Microvirga sp. CF3016]
MPTSWKRSHKADLWRRLDPGEASRVMAGSYGEGAGAEVLLRAFLEERDRNPAAVRFWLRVYDLLSSSGRPRAAPG